MKLYWRIEMLKLLTLYVLKLDIYLIVTIVSDICKIYIVTKM